MGSFKTFAAAGVMTLAAIASSGGAFAADLLSGPPPMPAPPIPSDFGGGWYLRGDVGVSAYDEMKFSSPDLPPAVFYGNEVSGGSFAGIGVGYQFTRWFRADVTGEYRFASQVKVYDKIAFTDANGLPGVTNEVNEGKYSAVVAMINGYFDLGHWYGITPFIGAGVGVAYNRFAGFSDSSLTSETDANLNPVTFPSGGFYHEGTKTGLAWALHAGLAYDVTPNFKVELAYRYLNLGEGRTGALNCFCAQTFSPLKIKDIDSHDIKLGMRWVFNSPAPAMDMPLVRKY